MKIQNSKFTAGDLARFYGITLDTIRFYDKKGILIPEEKSEKDYRIYSRTDVITLDHVLKLKNAGIPLKHIEEFLNHFTLEEAYHYCQERLQELNEELDALNRQKKELISYMQSLELIMEDWEHITLELSPALYMKDVSVGMAAARSWLWERGFRDEAKLAAYSGVSAKYYTEGQILTKEERAMMADCYLAVPLSKNGTDENMVPEEGDFIWPRQMCVHAYFRSVSGELNTVPDLRRIQEFVKKHNFKLKGDTVCWILFTEKNQEQRVDYYDCWYAVEI